MLRTTTTGNIFLGVSLIMYLASLTSQSGLLLFPIGILLGCFVVNAYSARHIVKTVEVEAPGSTELSEGGKLAQPWKITNTGRGAAGFLRVRSRAGMLFRIGGIGPGESASIVPSGTFECRGVYPYEEVEILSFHPFGLLVASRKLELTGEIVVHPAVYETAPPMAAGYDVMVGGKFRGQLHSATGSAFSGVRPLQPFDPLKHIHWKSSAKGLGLMTKTFDEELSGRIALLVDGGEAGESVLLDDCLRAAGSLMFAALDEGHHVEWVDLGTGQHRLLPPFTDGHEILDTLARVTLTPECLTADTLESALHRVSRKGSLVLLLTTVNDSVREFVAEATERHRRISLYVPEMGVDLSGLAGVRIHTYSEHAIGAPASIGP